MWRPGSAQRVRVCDMWRRAVTCLWLVRSSARSIAGSRTWTVRPRDGFAGPTTSEWRRSCREEAGRGACPLPAKCVGPNWKADLPQSSRKRESSVLLIVATSRWLRIARDQRTRRYFWPLTRRRSQLGHARWQACAGCDRRGGASIRPALASPWHKVLPVLREIANFRRITGMESARG